MASQLLLGIDVGTTSVKASLFDGTGARLRSYASGFPTTRRGANVEQDPEDWMRHVRAALAHLVDAMPKGAVAAAGLCSQVNTHVFVDAEGNALLPAIVWQDGRCAAEAAALDAKVPETDKLQWWRAPMPIDASHVLARIAWVAKHHPGLWDRTCWVLSPKDYCLLKLTGEVVADPMSSFGVIDQSLAYIDALTGLVPGAKEKLPPLASLAARAGRIRKGLPGEGTPVAVGTMDAWAGMFGAGAVREGQAVYLSGTSEVGGILSHRRVPTPGVIAFPECEGFVLHAGPTQAGGASVEWLGRLLGKSPEELSRLAADIGAGEDVPVFLPHLQGERAPIWDIASRASFSGIDSGMGPAHFARAVFEGVAYSVRWLMESLEQSAGLAPGRIHLAGGGARSDAWCQIRADILGKPLRRASNPDAGVMGAAILAGVERGLYGSIAEAAEALVGFDQTFDPGPGTEARHAAGYAKFRALYDGLKDFNRTR
jgi:xylulokinase